MLSRVTLGADVAVTSVLLSAAKQAFPNAEIVFAGPRKNFELFAADSRLTHAAVEYRRGNLQERLAVGRFKTLPPHRIAWSSTQPRLALQLGLLPTAKRIATISSKAARMAATAISTFPP